MHGLIRKIIAKSEQRDALAALLLDGVAGKARIELAGWGKRVTAPVCISWTKLIGNDHCSDDLAAIPGKRSGAIKIDLSGRLADFA